MSVTVLHVAQPCDGGVARYVLAACLDQAARGWRPVVACPDGGRLAEDLEGAGLPRLRWQAVRSPGPESIAEARRLRALIDNCRPDVVHLHASKAGLAGRLRQQLPTVFQPHGWSWLAVDGAMRAASIAWERLAARRTDLFVCVGEAEAQLGRSYGIHGRFAVVHNGVDLDRFQPADDSERTAARGRLGLPVTAPLAVCVGRVTRQKGQDVLLAAWPSVRRQCPTARLAIVGDGELLTGLRARPLPGVIFVGAVGDVRPWLTAADVVVLPSRWEGLPLTVLEAFAVGRAVVVSDVPGLSDVVTPEVGARVAPCDQRQLAEALACRLHQPTLVRMEGAAAARHAERFDLRVTLDNLAAETLALARNGRRRPSECSPELPVRP